MAKVWRKHRPGDTRRLSSAVGMGRRPRPRPEEKLPATRSAVPLSYLRSKWVSVVSVALAINPTLTAAALALESADWIARAL